MTGEAPMWNFYKFIVCQMLNQLLFFLDVGPESQDIMGLLEPYFEN